MYLLNNTKSQAFQCYSVFIQIVLDTFRDHEDTKGGSTAFSADYTLPYSHVLLHITQLQLFHLKAKTATCGHNDELFRENFHTYKLNN